MVAAAAVEARRLQLFREGRTIHESSTATGLGHGSSIVDMSVFWQTAQYLLVGLSEVRGIPWQVLLRPIRSHYTVQPKP